MSQNDYPMIIQLMRNFVG